jgi:hypothetical protein
MKAIAIKSRLNTESKLSAHRHKDFDIEEERILREMRRLKLLMWRRHKTKGTTISLD